MLLVQVTDGPVCSVPAIFALVGETSWDDDARIVENVPLRRVSPPSASWVSRTYGSGEGVIHLRQSVMWIACTGVNWAKKSINRSTGECTLCGTVPMLEVLLLVLILGRLKLFLIVNRRSYAPCHKRVRDLHRRPLRPKDLVQ